MTRLNASMLAAFFAALIGLTSCRAASDTFADPGAEKTAARTDQAAAETPTSVKPLDPANLTGEDALRYQEAMENIQTALDEDPEEAARFLGATPVQNLDLESLEELGNRAHHFTQMKMFERIRELQEERRRIRELQDLQELQELQNARR